MRTFFFFNDTATTEIYTLSLHDALPIFATSVVPEASQLGAAEWAAFEAIVARALATRPARTRRRSEEHTSELQSPCNLVCRLLLEKKKAENFIQTLPTSSVYPNWGRQAS